MSIADQITRLKTAKEAQAAALTAKGVTVPSGAGFEEFPDLIRGIQSGGDTSKEDGLITRTLIEYENDRVTQIGNAAFENNLTLVSVSFPNVTTFNGINHFYGCTALERINFPKLESASGGNAFRYCSSLKKACFPMYKAGGPSFDGCTALEYVDFGKEAVDATAVTMCQITNCSALKVIVLRYNRLIILGNINRVTGSSFAVGGTGGTVYVPQALIESYKSATNWSALYEAGTCTFLPIEGSEYE